MAQAEDARLSDAEQRNRDRAHWGAAGLEAWRKARGGGDCLEDGDDLRDMLADLRHYCAVHGIDFDNEARVSADHFEVESKGME